MITELIEWGWAGRGFEEESGDLHVVVPFEGGALVALLDGLGHGPGARAAVIAAVPVLQSYARETLPVLVQRCHDALRRTRGAAMTLATFRGADDSLTWIGIGNVDGVLIRSNAEHRDQAIGMRGGVVGYQLPPLHVETHRVAPGDALIMATDGIHSGFSSEAPITLAPQELAESILARFAKGSDDAHVVVARYRGAGR